MHVLSQIAICSLWTELRVRNEGKHFDYNTCPTLTRKSTLYFITIFQTESEFATSKVVSNTFRLKMIKTGSRPSRRRWSLPIWTILYYSLPPLHSIVSPIQDSNVRELFSRFSRGTFQKAFPSFWWVPQWNLFGFVRQGPDSIKKSKVR